MLDNFIQNFFYEIAKVSYRKICFLVPGPESDFFKLFIIGNWFPFLDNITGFSSKERVFYYALWVGFGLSTQIEIFNYSTFQTGVKIEKKLKISKSI